MSSTACSLVTTPQRSALMKGIRRKDTVPELTVRRALHAEGFRYRLHPNDLPGKPDIVLPKYKTVVFVHGCFWHGHDCAHGSKVPKTNREFWLDKIADNRRRDASKAEHLRTIGWRVVVLWECEVRGPAWLPIFEAEVRSGQSRKSTVRSFSKRRRPVVRSE